MDEVQDEASTQVEPGTKDEEEREWHAQSKADRMPSKDEEDEAEEASDELEQSGSLDEVGANYREMTRIGSEAKGEGRIS